MKNRGETAASALERGTKLIKNSPVLGHSGKLGTWAAANDARKLLAAVIGKSALESTPRERLLAPAESKQYDGFLKQRVGGLSVALITGHFEFLGLDVVTRPGVFLPRRSTELLAQLAIAKLSRRRTNRVAVDLCTGSGVVAFALAHSVPNAQIRGVDISADAIDLAKHNARRLKLANVSFAHGDLFGRMPKELSRRVSVVTVHLPYVPADDIPEKIGNFEPNTSWTDGSPDGLGLLRRIIVEAGTWLAPDATLLVQVGAPADNSAAALLTHGGFGRVVVHRRSHPAYISRIVEARWRGERFAFAGLPESMRRRAADLFRQG